MKTLIRIAQSTLLIATLFLASCSKDSSSSSNPTPSGSNYFKLDGTLVTLDEVNVTVYDNAIAGGRYIDVYGLKGGEQVLELHMPAAVGNYPAQHTSFSMTSSWLTYQNPTESNFELADFHSNSGTMNVATFNEADQKLVATFSFVGGNSASATHNITEGHLNLTAF
ncbi:hypothetical protein KIH23_00380 [Flavobacterium sp. CYK-55]|uniref:hypothetical protein n=1 Tax=Flavobacterium sp. CYK-55 TaxID=2835529 RepID=UPI001BD0E271|nr:hypothetical protein [Flavobacterium sp. CYK-55]MBS7785738.1 hypothetical protein [Flavobacterium sp. CYK-55]